MKIAPFPAKIGFRAEPQLVQISFSHQCCVGGSARHGRATEGHPRQESIGRDRLSGTVDIDEIYIGGKRAGKRGRGAEGKALVFVAVESKGNRIGRIRLKRIPDASAGSLEPAIKGAVEPGTIINTDDWRGYSGVSKIGYKHEIVHKSSEVGVNLLPRVNIIASLLKRWLLGTYQGRIQAPFLDYYLDEFIFRFNRRTSGSRGKLFYRLVQQAMTINPLPVKKICSQGIDS